MVFIRRTKEYILHLGANEDQFQAARSLRHKMTQAERVLWNELKNRKLNGLKFLRQHPILLYIADFYCHEKKLIIEVDGGIHNDKKIKEHDENRSAELERMGITVLRVTNEQVLNSLVEVINLIKQSLSNDSA
jgi:very-short-patch-repair endonuclease